jgi:cyanophycin synthetase
MTIPAVGSRDAAPSTVLRVLETGVYRGPHLYSHTPMVRIQLDLGSLEEWPTDRLSGFAERLVELLPGLERHGCCYRKPGGFLRRLHDGTWLGHVAEHVALELQTMAGSRVTRGKTRSVKGKPGVYNVMYAYRDETAGRLAGRLALALVDSLLPPELQGVQGLDCIYRDEGDGLDGPFTLSRGLDVLSRLVRRTAFGPTTQSLVDEAERRGIPVMRLNDMSLVQLGYGKHQQRVRASISGNTSLIAVETAGDKDLTKRLLSDAGIPVPRGTVVRTADAAADEAKRLGFPVVTKPLDGNHGRGVSIALGSEEQVRWGFEQAVQHSRRVLVEQQFIGRDHRILVVGGRLVAVAERVPAHVIGDGRRSIAELVAEVNRDPRRGDGHEKVMTRIRIDAHVVEYLGRLGRTVDSVPGAGETVYLCATANLSTGGTAIDRTDDIHPENAAIAKRAARIVGLDIAGIDFIAPDIRRSVRETGGGIIEVNAAPGFRMHLEPSEGTPRNIARPVIDMLFPPGSPSRIPVLAVTGTNGKSTTTRMLKHILRHTGCTVGMTSTSGVYIDDECVAPGDATGPRSARLVLRDPTVEVAVLETARGGTLREGLGFDSCDIGIVTNVQPDHLGLKGIDTIEDLAWVKSLVVETVARNGTSVLNADDPLVAGMHRRAGGRIAYFSLNGGRDTPDFLRDHIADGGLAVVREPGPSGGVIVVHDRMGRDHVMHAAEIPATLDGMAEFNIANALAAITAAVAHGVPVPTIRSALATFQSSYETNPGRLNVHDGHGFRVIMDYAHNPSGLEALGELIRRMRPLYRRTVGLVAIPGDRRDDDIREMGRIAGTLFDHLFFREDPSTRGRPRGEIMRLMTEGAALAGVALDRITSIVREDDATIACLKAAGPGDLVVMTPTDVEGTWQRVLEFQSPCALAPLRAGPVAPLRHAAE